MLNVFAAPFEFELDLIKEKPNEGIKETKAHEEKLGRPIKSEKIDIAKCVYNISWN